MALPPVDGRRRATTRRIITTTVEEEVLDVPDEVNDSEVVKPTAQDRKNIQALIKLKADQSKLNAAVKKLEAEVKAATEKAPGKEITTYIVVGGEKQHLRSLIKKGNVSVFHKDKLLSEITLQAYADIATPSKTDVTATFGKSMTDKVFTVEQVDKFECKPYVPTTTK